jgi:hypothetical protein
MVVAPLGYATASARQSPAIEPPCGAVVATRRSMLAAMLVIVLMTAMIAAIAASFIARPYQLDADE